MGASCASPCAPRPRPRLPQRGDHAVTFCRTLVVAYGGPCDMRSLAGPAAFEQLHHHRARRLAGLLCMQLALDGRSCIHSCVGILILPGGWLRGVSTGGGLCCLVAGAGSAPWLGALRAGLLCVRGSGPTHQLRPAEGSFPAATVPVTLFSPPPPSGARCCLAPQAGAVVAWPALEPV